MTHDILPSDVALAETLIRANHSEAEVVSALRLRGVESTKAARLIDDLRHGRSVATLSPMDLAQPLWPKAETPDDAPAAHRQTRRPHGDSVSSRHGSSRLSARRRFVVAGVAVVCIAGAGWLLWKRFGQGKPAARTEATDIVTSSGAPASPTGLVLDGLRIGSNRVTRQNALSAISGVLGLPTRTNSDQPRTIYAYDRQGVLFYSGEGATNDSIVLDCDAMGGTNGTTQAFAGSLKVDENTIGVDTDAGVLTAIKKLGLSKLASDSATYKGRCRSLDLYFSYLKTPARLSFIEIDLKE
jgi:hypothetical protein